MNIDTRVFCGTISNGRMTRIINKEGGSGAPSVDKSVSLTNYSVILCFGVKLSYIFGGIEHLTPHAHCQIRSD